MKIVRFVVGDAPPALGVLQDQVVHVLDGDMYANPQPGRVVALLAEVRLLAPCRPGKIVAVGRNYAAHAAEHDADVPPEPLLFLKPPSAVVGPGDPIILPPQSQRVEHEAELVAVVGRRARNVHPAEALAYLLGFTCGNDVTARDLQRRDGQWTRGKGFDTFCPLGPWIETELDPAALDVIGRVNGEVRQRGNTNQLVFTVPYLVCYITRVMTLEPGDMIMTGTPAGVGPLRAGDLVEVEVQGVGVLANTVEAGSDERTC